MWMPHLLPARFNDKLLVKTRIASVRRTSVIFEQEIVTDDEQQLLVNKATIRVACVDMKTMKPAAMPDYLKEEIARDWC